MAQTSGPTIFSFTHIEEITGEKVGVVDDRAGERQAAGVYGTGFTVARVVARDQIGFDKNYVTRKEIERHLPDF
jgi:hypothetical protein